MQSAISPDPIYPMHPGFAARAGLATEVWRTTAGALLFVAGFVLLPSLAGALLLPAGMTAAFWHGETAAGVLFQFAAMLLPTLALRGILISLHDRGLLSVVGGLTDTLEMAWRVSKIAFLVLLAEQVLTPWPNSDAIAFVRPVAAWLALGLMSVPVILVQVAGEEMFFRGYLQQQIRARTPSRLWWMGLPSALFGLAHYLNADGAAEGVLWTLWAFGLAMACADLTARAGSIGPAIGLHFVNNLFALLLIGMDQGPMSGLALILVPYVDPATVDHSLSQLATAGGLVQMLLIGLEITVLWLAARLAIRR